MGLRPLPFVPQTPDVCGQPSHEVDSGSEHLFSFGGHRAQARVGHRLSVQISLEAQANSLAAIWRQSLDISYPAVSCITSARRRRLRLGLTGRGGTLRRGGWPRKPRKAIRTRMPGPVGSAGRLATRFTP